MKKHGFYYKNVETVISNDLTHLLSSNERKSFFFFFGLKWECFYRDLLMLHTVIVELAVMCSIFIWATYRYITTH